MQALAGSAWSAGRLRRPRAAAGRGRTSRLRPRPSTCAAQRWGSPEAQKAPSSSPAQPAGHTPCSVDRHRRRSRARRPALLLLHTAAPPAPASCRPTSKSSHSRMPYKIEKAKSGRAKCQGCKETIDEVWVGPRWELPPPPTAEVAWRAAAEVAQAARWCQAQGSHRAGAAPWLVPPHTEPSLCVRPSIYPHRRGFPSPLSHPPFAAACRASCGWGASTRWATGPPSNGSTGGCWWGGATGGTTGGTTSAVHHTPVAPGCSLLRRLAAAAPLASLSKLPAAGYSAACSCLLPASPGRRPPCSTSVQGRGTPVHLACCLPFPCLALQGLRDGQATGEHRQRRQPAGVLPCGQAWALLFCCLCLQPAYPQRNVRCRQLRRAGATLTPSARRPPNRQLPPALSPLMDAWEPASCVCAGL